MLSDPKIATYLFPVILYWHTENALSLIPCDLVNFCIESWILTQEKRQLLDY